MDTEQINKMSLSQEIDQLIQKSWEEFWASFILNKCFRCQQVLKDGVCHTEGCWSVSKDKDLQKFKEAYREAWLSLAEAAWGFWEIDSSLAFPGSKEELGAIVSSFITRWRVAHTVLYTTRY